MFNTDTGNVAIFFGEKGSKSRINNIAFSLESRKQKKDGLNCDNDGIWRYYKNNKFTQYTGVLNFEGGKFFVADGYLCSDANGLAEYGGKWYFLANGQVQTQYTGLALYDGWWFYITKGVLDTSKKGLVPYDGSLFLVADGQILRNVSGLWYDSFNTHEWYYLADGQVTTYFTGLAQYQGAWFLVENGKLATYFTGYVETVSGAIYRVVSGRVLSGTGLLNGAPEFEPTAEEVINVEPDYSDTTIEDTPANEELPVEPSVETEPVLAEPAVDHMLLSEIRQVLLLTSSRQL